MIDLSTLKPGDTVTKFEDELRGALAVDDRPVNQLGVARYDFAMKHQKPHTSVIEDAASLLLEILPELREMVEARAAVVCAEMEVMTYENYPNGYAVYEAIPGMGYCFAEKWEERATADRIENLRAFGKFSATAANSTTTLTEKLKKAGVL